MGDAPIRELFIVELEQVHGGGPVEELLNQVPTVDPESGIISDPPLYTTLACGEEAGSGC